MKPKEIGEAYDKIASWWLKEMKGSTYGIVALENALRFLEGGKDYLDVGCGAEGRFLKILSEKGFKCTGLDVSKEMISLIKVNYPEFEFQIADIVNWQLPRKYDLITAWDSTFHLPLLDQEPVLKKLCSGLNEKGVLLFTCGGGEKEGEVQGEMNGTQFSYSTLGVPKYLDIISKLGCTLLHLEYDQYPENHVYIIAKKDK